MRYTCVELSDKANDAMLLLLLLLQELLRMVSSMYNRVCRQTTAVRRHVAAGTDCILGQITVNWVACEVHPSTWCMFLRDALGLRRLRLEIIERSMHHFMFSVTNKCNPSIGLTQHYVHLSVRLSVRRSGSRPMSFVKNTYSAGPSTRRITHSVLSRQPHKLT